LSCSGETPVRNGSNEFAVLQLRTFGGLSIEVNGAPATGAAVQRKTLALLALLAAAGKNGLSRDKLTAYLWPESDAEHGRSLLKQACYALRRDLHEPELLLGATELRLNPAAITSDIQCFEAALERGDAAQAVALHAGPFLDGFYLSDSIEFERWVEAERERLRQCVGEALETLATKAAAQGDQQATVNWWRWRAALEPLNSRVAVELMTALAAAGDRAGALQHARIHDALLRDDLDAVPDAAVVQLTARLREESAPPVPPLPPVPPEVHRDRESAPSDAVTEAALPPAARPQTRRVGVKLGLGAALATMLGAALFWRSESPVELDPNLLAVAPFDVFDRKLELWHEGLVDVLSRKLDGAGPFRTVSPTVVIRHWTKRPDRASAKALGVRTGAGFVVFGQLLMAGPDSVRLGAALVDTRKGRTLVEVERADQADRIDRLVDSLSVDVIRTLTPTTSGAHVQLHSVGTKSLAALKAFLQGERLFRRFALDSAIANYDRAIALDTTFALALRRANLARGWNDQNGAPYAARAVLFNHGLGPRDSLLVAADSSGSLMFLPGARRTFAILEEAARRYPEDPEIWYQIGEARFHAGFVAGQTWSDARAAFDRAIALDSAFAPAYIHPVEIALNDNDAGAALRYVRGYLAVSSVIPDAGGMRLLGELLDPARPRPPDFDRELEGASPPALYHLALAVQSWPDSNEIQLQVARRAAASARGSGNVVRVYRLMLPSALIHRGHLQEAQSIVGNRFGMAFMELAGMGAIPRDTVDSVVARWFQHADDQDFLYFPWFAEGPCYRTLDAALWWAARKDTASLQGLVRRDRPAPAFARAALALARGDTTLALSRFLAIPDSLCPDARRLREMKFRLLAAAGRGSEAAAVFDSSHDRHVPLVLDRARLAERLGDRPTAIKYYQFVVQAWLHADPELQPYVAEARTALERLGGEPRVITSRRPA